MSKFYMPTSGPEDWKAFLADPEKHWKSGYSAKSLAYSWETAQGIPTEVKELLASSAEAALHDIELLLAIPEHKVPLPGGMTKSQNDIFLLCKADSDLVSIAVEGKVAESFDKTLGEWFEGASKGKKERLAYIKEHVGLETEIPPSIRYQLLHRTASAVIEALRFNATKAVMLVHSFSQESLWFEDYRAFVSLYGKSIQVGELVHIAKVKGVSLYTGWAKGDKKFLSA